MASTTISGTSITPATEIICPMYARVSQIEDFLKETPHGLDRPVILCEYEHAMGNSGGSTYAYWDAVDRWPWFQGPLKSCDPAPLILSVSYMWLNICWSFVQAGGFIWDW